MSGNGDPKRRNNQSLAILIIGTGLLSFIGVIFIVTDAGWVEATGIILGEIALIIATFINEQRRAAREREKERRDTQKWFLDHQAQITQWEKENGFRERELDLRERELDLKEREIEVQESKALERFIP